MDALAPSNEAFDVRDEDYEWLVDFLRKSSVLLGDVTYTTRCRRLLLSMHQAVPPPSNYEINKLAALRAMNSRKEHEEQQLNDLLVIEN